MRRVSRIFAALAAAVLLLTAEKGCGSSDSGTADVASTANPLDTPKSATCRDWLDATQDARDEASQRFVVALKAFDQSDGFAHEFAVNISRACEPAPQLKLPEVVGSLATLDTEDFPR